MNKKDLREKMLERFENMLRPARIILDMSRREFAEISGLPENLIADVEEGRTSFSKSHYLALAAVFDNAKFTEDKNIYEALIRVLTPENEFASENSSLDFVLVRRWFRSFEQPEIEDENFSEDSEEIIDRFSDSELEDITANYKIFADDSAAADENFPALITRLEPMLKRNGRSIIIPKLAIKKLEEDIKTCADNETEFNISQSLEHIQRKQDEGLIEIHETASNDIDEEFTEILADGNKFMLITQEIGRAELLTSENPYASAAHIDDKGDLIAW